VEQVDSRNTPSDQFKKTRTLYYWKAKFKATKIEVAPLESNVYFTELIKSYILKHPECIQSLDNLS
jgi:hypothetical protein